MSERRVVPIVLHPNAMIWFNEQMLNVAADLQVKPVAMPGPVEETPRLTGPVHELSASEMTIMHRSTLEGDRTVARSFPGQVAGEELSVEGENYKKFSAACITSCQKKPLKGVAGAESLEIAMLQWFKAKLDGSAESPGEFLERHLNATLSEFEYLIPIYQFSLDKALRVGPVQFETISSELVEKWLQTMPEGQIREGFRQKFLNEWCLDGAAVAKLIVRAEQGMGLEIAEEKAAEACAYLRCFSASALKGQLRSHLEPWGRQYAPKRLSIHCKDGSICQIHYGNVESGFLHVEHFAAGKIDELNSKFLSFLNRILDTAKPSELEIKLLRSLTLIGRGALARDLEECLFYTLSALESFVLGGSTESTIMATVGDRLSMYLCRTYEDAKDLQAVFARVYKVRSNFVHHGLEIEPSEDIDKLLLVAWTFLVELLTQCHLLTTQADFFEHLERRKYK